MDPTTNIGSGRGIGAFAVIADEAGRVLLAHRRDGDFWMQPGGGVESGETPWQAVVREETGLEVTVERLAGVYCWPQSGELIFSFVCAVTGGQLSPGAAPRDVRFFPPGALPPTTFAEHRQRIADALVGRPQALLSVPSGLSAPEEVRRAHRQASG